MERRSQNPFAKRPIASLALPLLAAGLVLAEFLTSQVLFLAMVGPPPEAAVP